MKAGFSLVELMAVLLLTGILLSSLFLFTFYFWKNHVDQMQYLQFTDQKQIFLDWLHMQLRNSSGLEVQERQLVLEGKDGTPIIVKFTAEGPEYDGITFFNHPTEVKVSRENDTAKRVHLEFIFVQGRWTNHEQVWVHLNSATSFAEVGHP